MSCTGLVSLLCVTLFEFYVALSASIFQELLALFDSPLAKADKLKVFVHTTDNVLFQVNSQTRLPRTYNRFAGLIVQLLQTRKIRSPEDNGVLLKVIKNPIGNHVPTNSRVVVFSKEGDLYSPFSLASSLLFPAPASSSAPSSHKPLLPNDSDSEEEDSEEEEEEEEEEEKKGGDDEDSYQRAPLLVFGAMAVGSVDESALPPIDHTVAISEFPLSGSAAIHRVITAIEHHLGII